MSVTRVLILGAGIQGLCCALELARRGIASEILEAAETPFDRASRRNEGKIHLGLVYANDPGLRTARLLLRSALAFRHRLEEQVGAQLPWKELTSHPFLYLVRHDSMVSPDDLLARYDEMQRDYRELQRAGAGDYLGLRPESLLTPARSIDARIDAGSIAAAFDSEERAVDREALRGLLIHALESSDRIRFLGGHRIVEVSRTSGGFSVKGEGPAGTFERRAERVVNCLWHGRLDVDAQLGLTPRRRWLFRLKHRALVETPRALQGLPSVTLVLGPFGDLVTFPHRPSYVSWYPEGMTAVCDALSIPGDWNASISGALPAAEQARLAKRMLQGFEELVPGISRSQVLAVDGGVIFGWGETDIDDPDSELHKRHEIGVHTSDGYYSIDTGKFTCAPSFAYDLGERIHAGV